jgi:glycosyltransferase involved in cell wall biosynthesis
LLNYMAVALPTVAFDTPVAREYLGPDGLFAVPGDVQSLAQHLCAALFGPDSTSEDLRSRGQHLRRRAMECFSWDVTGRQIANTYRQLLGDAGAAGLIRPEWTATYK